jgi:acyl-CoA synthetase (AMP-forming)/AMP-acid ligase II
VNIATLLEMAAEGFSERVAVGSRPDGLTYRELHDRARRVAGSIAGDYAGLIDTNSAAVPILLYGSAMAGRPFTPLNYRLADDALRALVERIAPAFIVTDTTAAARVGPVEGVRLVPRDDFLAGPDREADPGTPSAAVDDPVAVVLFTSGTTGTPKAAILRHSNLFAYITSTVDFMSAGEDEAALVSVPPYHIAGISAVLSSVYAGRRLVYLEAFDPVAWVDAVRRESVTHAMVVPTMLSRILDALSADGRGLPSLRALSYGGGRMPLPTVERALSMLPDVDFVNAYGLTETSSTVALLGPEDHRAAVASGDPAERARLASVGRPIGGVDLQIRDADGADLPAGRRGAVWVRGPQVAGEYLGASGRTDGEWFGTNDAGHLDAGGYLFIDGRMDDVIVRGGENISPGEIEATLAAHPGVTDVAVVGLPDLEWGERIAAVVVPATDRPTVAELTEFVRRRLRSARTPDVIEFRESLPYNESGTVLRRVLRQELRDA